VTTYQWELHYTSEGTEGVIHAPPLLRKRNPAWQLGPFFDQPDGKKRGGLGNIGDDANLIRSSDHLIKKRRQGGFPGAKNNHRINRWIVTRDHDATPRDKTFFFSFRFPAPANSSSKLPVKAARPAPTIQWGHTCTHTHIRLATVALRPVVGAMEEAKTGRVVAKEITNYGEAGGAKFYLGVTFIQ